MLIESSEFELLILLFRKFNILLLIVMEQRKRLNIYMVLMTEGELT